MRRAAGICRAASDCFGHNFARFDVGYGKRGAAGRVTFRARTVWHDVKPAVKS